MKVKALAVAPYEGLAIQLDKAAQLRDDIDVKCITGDLEEGLLLARSEFDGSYDVVISRGGTADLLRENGFTVVDIPTSSPSRATLPSSRTSSSPTPASRYTPCTGPRMQTGSCTICRRTASSSSSATRSPP